jgi:hypothetical protein
LRRWSAFVTNLIIQLAKARSFPQKLRINTAMLPVPGKAASKVLKKESPEVV